MASLFVWLLLLAMGGTGGIVICSLFEGNEVLILEREVMTTLKRGKNTDIY